MKLGFREVEENWKGTNGLKEQRSPTFLAPETGFMEDNFSTDQGEGAVSGRFKCITFIVHFISIITL